MECKREKCSHYELWDSSYQDDDGIWQEYVVEFCHHCEDGIRCKHCADCENWYLYEDYECNWKFDEVKK